MNVRRITIKNSKATTERRKRGMNTNVESCSRTMELLAKAKKLPKMMMRVMKTCSA
jgi:hypothetical protein